MDETKVEQGLDRARHGIYLALWLSAATLVSFAILIILLGRPRVPDTAVTAIATAGITGAVSVILAVVNFFDRQREADERLITQRQAKEERAATRREENVFRALDYFTGQTQRRNVGVAIVEGYLHELPELRGILIPLLVNQGKYLLLKSDQKEAEHEVDNCLRIMQLLIAPDKTDREFTQYYEEILGAVQKRLAMIDTPNEGRRGVKVSRDQLTTWETQLQAKLSGP